VTCSSTRTSGCRSAKRASWRRTTSASGPSALPENVSRVVASWELHARVCPLRISRPSAAPVACAIRRGIRANVRRKRRSLFGRPNWGELCVSRRQSEIKSPILMLQSVCIHRLNALFLRDRFPGNLLSMLSAARDAALSAGLTRFLAAPFVSGSSQVRRSPSLAGNLTLLGTVHRRKTAILYTHNVLIHQNALVISTASQGPPGCNRCAAMSCASQQ